MANFSTNDPGRPKRIKADLKEAAESAGRLRQGCAEQAKEYGYAEDMLGFFVPQFENMPDHPSLGRTEQAIRRVRDFFKKKENEMQAQMFDFSDLVYTSGTSTAITVKTISLDYQSRVLEQAKLPNPPDWWSPNEEDQLAARLDKLDPELGKLMQSAWNCFYGQQDERAAVFSMRQLYDHFFNLLAPDEDVRNSTFFMRKKGDRPNQVSRRERLKYAANIKVTNPEQKELLLSQTNYTLDTYSDLNKLHTYGALGREEVRKILLGMERLLKQWMDAIGI